MCYTKNASIVALITGLTSSLALIFLGNEKYANENLSIGLFFILVSFVQLMDYLIYIDPKCKTGANQIAGYVGSFLTILQPSFIFFLFMILLKPTDKNALYNKHMNFFIAVNVLYLIGFYVMYSHYILSQNVCSKQENGRFVWSWRYGPIASFTYFGYPIVLLINVILLLSINKFYINLAIILTTIAYFISKLNYQNHVAEFWCYFSNSVPLIILVIQRIIG